MTLLQLAPSCGISHAEIHPFHHRLYYVRDSWYTIHTGHHQVALFSPDGTSILTATADNFARLTNVENGEVIHHLKGDDVCENTPSAWCKLTTRSTPIAAFSSDGKQIITVLKDNIVRLWDANNGEMLYILKESRLWIRSAMFSQNDEHVYAITESGQVWDIANGRLLFNLSGHQRLLHHACLSPDGKQFAVASADHHIYLHNAKNGDLQSILKAHHGRVLQVRYSPNNQYLASVSADKTAIVWNLAKQQPSSIFKGHNARVNAVDFSADGRFLVTASADKTARIWHILRGQTLQILRGHHRPINSARFSPDGQWIITAANDNTVRTWETTR